MTRRLMVTFLPASRRKSPHFDTKMGDFASARAGQVCTSVIW
ncbi:Uncharacterised protein [Mycobacterium tuberculosis]|uniref:Uncharacterized protein n=1 Tax=Mycobacterium tuberculosis TaxID=1773 RepID=A0A0U0QK32_MYCTX|nr:Uncharacterised protein [Mycobacterium tuberculosis]COW44525.1 Uncharacterised protein [Mycobacterium tuberculosis]COW67719.1 Uncharacterised protein [Mycobacterium tuberculosis]COY37970.1 Uncharacterised protein [Mycobacterium tuberculosis]